MSKQTSWQNKEQKLNITYTEKVTMINAFTRPRPSKDDYHLNRSVFRLRTGLTHTEDGHLQVHLLLRRPNYRAFLSIRCIAMWAL